MTTTILFILWRDRQEPVEWTAEFFDPPSDERILARLKEDVQLNRLTLLRCYWDKGGRTATVLMGIGGVMLARLQVLSGSIG